MEHFRNHRNLYSTIKDFMPEIVSFVNYTASDFDNVLKEYDNKEPYITDIFPISNSILPLGIDTIQIRFSKPMFGAYGIRPYRHLIQTISRFGKINILFVLY